MTGRAGAGGSAATVAAASRSACAIPASSAGDSPLMRIATRNAPACTGLTSPASRAAVAIRASSNVNARLPRGPVPTALMTARKTAVAGAPEALGQGRQAHMPSQR